MKAVHKYGFDTDQNEFSLELKQGYKIIHAEFSVIDKRVYVWIEQPLAVQTPVLNKRFKLVPCDVPVNDSFEHLCTAVDPFSPVAFHLFGERSELCPVELSSHKESSSQRRSKAA